MVSAYEANRRLFFNIAYTYVRDTAIAEDIVQDAFVKAMEIARDTEIAHPKAYLVTAVRNRSINFIASQARNNTVPLDNSAALSVVSSEPLQDTILEDREKLRVFITALEALPPKCKRVLLLKKLHGLSLRETAETLGISVSTVQKHLTKALYRCGQYMAKNGYGE